MHAIPSSPLGPVIELPYVAPYDWDWMLGFLTKRAIKGVESVSGEHYRRSLRIGEACGTVRVSNEASKHVLRFEVSPSLARVVPEVNRRISRLFDTATDPGPIAERLGPLAHSRPGIRVPGSAHGFEMGVRAILGQQVSVSGAITLAGRFVERFGEPLPRSDGGLTHTFPTARDLAEADPDEVSILGMPRTRGRTIVALAGALEGGEVVLAPGGDVQTTMSALRVLPGIGEWTAQYIAMRCLGWTDAFPHADLGVRKAMGLTSHREILQKAESWRPWRAYATMHLWASLESLGHCRKRQTG